MNIQWPTPRLFRGSTKTVLAGKDEIYEISESDYLIKSPMPLYDDADDTTELVSNGSFTGDASGWNLGTGWTYGSNKVTHTAGNTANMYQDDVFTDGEKYAVQITVADCTAGGITVYIGENANAYSFCISSNGTWTFQGVADGVDLVITPTTSFDGSVDSISAVAASGSIEESNSPWQFIDYGDNYMLLNETCIVYKKSDKLYVETSPLFNAGCYWRKRVILGGFTNFWNTAWQTFWNTKVTEADEEMDMSDNIVWWTSILGGDLYALFDNTIITESDDNLPMIWDFMRRNDGGHIRMSWNGEVRTIKPLGNGVAVYGSNGVTILRHSADLATFGKVDVTNEEGIISRCAVAGDDKAHVFVNGAGFFRMLTADGELKNLGYQEYGHLLRTPDVIATYDEQGREWYFANANYSFLLTEHGLCEKPNAPLSLFAKWGIPFGIVDYRGASDKFEIKTDVFDFDLPGNKTFGFFIIEYKDLTNVRAQVEYTTGTGSKFYRSKILPVNKAGVCRVGVTGTAFRVKVNGIAGRMGRITSMVARFQYGDKRFIRGVYGQSG